MYVKFPRNWDENLVHNKESLSMAKSWDIREETESTIVATWNQAVSIIYVKNKILRKKWTVNAAYAKNIMKLKTT
jgi:hypothetical protein